MSNKITKFRQILGNPLTTHNFYVSSPELGLDIPILVKTTVFPTEKMRMVTLYVSGERVQFPTIPANSGQWSCSIPESESGMVFRKVLEKKGNMWKQKTGLMLGLGAGVIGANLKVEVRGVGDKPVFSTIMHGTFVLGCDEVTLDADSPTTSLMWKVNFAYDWLEDVSNS